MEALEPRESKAPVEIWADVSCPFTWVSLNRLLAERDRRGSTRRLRLRGWPLEWVNGEPTDPALLRREVDALRATVAPELFRGFVPERRPATTVPALALAAAAYARGDDAGERVSIAVRAAVFEEGRDVADAGVLATIAAAEGIEPPDPAQGEAAVRAEFEEGRARGVEGSPHVFVAADDGRFCPTLHITHAGDRFAVAWRDDVAGALAGRLFGR